ncbi:MAG: hypothetical protein GF388_03010 [Candidatus Aegiribacteria sp.]|nr:hypothetical protein [Candidatus Aegiribacteria sp.]MBD3294247.1 hypothetical protein [Candidatus Fermentibacteria bacterium]
MFRNMVFGAAALLIFSSLAMSYDPLYFDNLTEALRAMEADGDMAVGYFSASSYWRTDSTGNSEEYEFDQSLGVLRFQFLGRYGLTNSHTISIVIPGFIQLQGPGDTTGVGIADPWISLDGWLTREPRLFARGAIRLPLKGALESGDYSESDRHLALDGALTVVTPLSAGSGINLEATGGLRYYMSAWDALFTDRRDSAETKPPIELKLAAFAVMPVNPELDFRIGGEISSRGETEAEINGSWTEQDGSNFNQRDLIGGITIKNQSMDITGEIFYRFGGENTNKEWGIMISGTGIDFTDLFSTSTR